MSSVSVLTRRIRALFDRRTLEKQLESEVRFHLEMQTEDNVKAGMSANEARYAALRAFGGVEPMKELYRERRGLSFVETTLQDFRYAIRTLRRSPAFSVTSIAVLALAIGVNTAMFSVLNAMLLRPLPYRSVDQLAMLWSEIPTQNLREGRTAYQSIQNWRQKSKSFDDIAFFDPASVTLTLDDRSTQISVLRISPNLLSVVGIPLQQGRAFSIEEAEQGQRLVLISQRFWQTHFGQSPAALDKTIELNGVASRIVGILPPDLPFFDSDVWEPNTLAPDWSTQKSAAGIGPWFVIGRLRPNVSFDRAQAEMDALARALSEHSSGGDRNQGVSVTPFRLQITPQRERLALWFLTAAVFCILLIAATNIASLSLARSISREAEIAIRAALGAGRARLIRQLLAESVCLAVIAGLFGLLVAYGILRTILILRPPSLSRLDNVSLDPIVLGWTLGLCLLTGLLVGIVPAVTVIRRNLKSSSAEGSRSVSSGVAARRTHHSLIVAEFALAIVLLVSAGLLIRSLWSIQEIHPGFRTDKTLLAQVSSPTTVPPAQRAQFFRRVLQEVESLPGIERAAIIGDLFIGGNPERVVITEEATQAVSERMRLRSDEISNGFFQTMGTPLIKGRFFSDSDGPESPPVAIVNETMARRLWPATSDPLGKRFRLGPENVPPRWFTVVGVVGNMRRQSLENDPIPQMFEPIAQNPSRLATLVIVTSSADPMKSAGSLRSAVNRVDRYAPVYHVSTLEDRFGALLSQRRFQTMLLMAFAAIALLMAAIGICGLVQYSVSNRTHEIGIRMALGAEAQRIFRMVLGESLKLSIIGLILGLVGALWVSRLGMSFLFGVSATDPLTFVSVSLLLIAVSFAASYLPARRAMAVNPVTALRRE